MDFNRLLYYTNYFLLLSTSIAFIYFGANNFIDIKVILVSIFLHLQISYLLNYERRFKNPYLIVLCLVIIFFYLLRILTLLIDEYHYSLVFTRIGSENICFKEVFDFLLFLYFSIWAIFFGIKLGSKQKLKLVDLNSFDINLLQIKKLSVLVFISLLYFMFSGFSTMTFGILLGLLTSFFNYEVFVMLLTIILFNYKNIVSPILYRTLIFMLSVFFLIKALSGSSGPMLRIGFPMFFALLVMGKNIYLRKTYLLLLIALLISTTFFGAYLKSSKEKISTETFLQFTRLDNDSYKFLFSQLVARSGFLDFSVEIINNKNYSKFINLPRYTHSIVDSFTPGFDVFDEPLTANILRAVYLYSFPSNPKKIDIVNDYHSDQINVFSEYFVLFGPLFSLVFLFLTSYGFQKIYYNINFSSFDLFTKYLLSASLLNYFWIWLRSFGLDWIIADLPAYVLPILLIIFIKKLKLQRES